jgi:hypothetical protein
MGKLIVALFLVTSAIAHADTQANYPALKGVDLSSAIRFFKPFVKTLKQPIYLWSWFDARGRNPIWTSNVPASDSIAADHVASASRLYWQSFCTGDSSQDPSDCQVDQTRMQFGSGNMYGPGFYAAVDPVTTSDYGNPSQGNWVLLQIKLPVGFKIVDYVAAYNTSMPSDVEQTLQTLGCPFSGYSFYESVFALNRSGRSYGKCSLAMRYIFRDVLQIDAFDYSYQGTLFPECKVQNHETAFVITNDEAFDSWSHRGATQAEVKVFNKMTTDAREDRVRIQSFFYKAESKDTSSDTYKIQNYYAANGIPGHPNSYVLNMDMSQMLMTVCPQNATAIEQCTKNMAIDSSILQAPAKTLISKSAPPQDWDGGGLLWDDLDGVPRDANLDKFITDDLFRCSRPSDFN